MFCSKCGKENNGNAKFCKNCGSTLNIKSENNNQDIEHFDYYGRNWRSAKGIAIASMPYFDIAVDNESVYIIELPKYHAGTWGFIIGLVVLNIIGMLIGAAIGSSIDTTKRNNFRGVWIDKDDNVISNKYEAVTLIKIPIKEAVDTFEFKKKSFKLTYQGKEYAFKTYPKNFEKFKSAINI